MIELQPVYDSVQSFYKKAHVVEEDNKTFLISYSTQVAQIIDGVLTINGVYSVTTLRHIKEFILQQGFKSGSKDELLEMYYH